MPWDSFLCPRDSCDRSFTTAFNLQSHINSFHEKQRPFACTHAGCGKTFAMKQSLQRHNIVHDPERKKLTKPKAKRSLSSRLSGYSETKASDLQTSDRICQIGHAPRRPVVSGGWSPRY
uniref:C2H2-type domain-containing protein n=1 Tax=Amphiprion percula TaxID=161767 RepID=A0A3P8SDF8_AMPPE